MKLSEDLRRPVSEPTVLFRAREAAWSKPVPFAKEEFGVDEDAYFSDGPSLLRVDGGELYMIFSSWGEKGYAVGAAISGSGEIEGPWRLQEKPVYPENGGHGMFFRDLDGEMILALHDPNDKYLERPVFWKIVVENGILTLGERKNS